MRFAAQLQLGDSESRSMPVPSTSSGSSWLSGTSCRGMNAFVSSG